MADTGAPLVLDREPNAAQVAATLRRVAVRLLPLLLLAYIANLLDRNNVGFAKLTMQADLQMSDAAFAFGTGMFYFGYLVFEVPSNLILRRTGARLWIARIMLTWGLVSCATMFVTGIRSFLSVRILLGVAEAGFFPGVIFYLTLWFPSRERTRAVAGFMAANALAGIFSNPLSGLIMQNLDQAGGLRGWQWIFLLESIPSLIVGVCIYFWLTDRPAEAHWLDDDERNWLVERMRQEEQRREQRHGADLLRALLAPRVWYLILLYFTVAFCLNAAGLYLPELIHNHFPNSSKSQIGLLAAVPSLCGVVGMLLNGWWSDHTRKYRLHVGLPAFLAAGGWVLAALADGPGWGLAGLSMAFLGMMSMLPPFWSLPTSFLSGAGAAGGIALINSVGNVGGLLGPVTMGLIHDATLSHLYGILALAGTLVLGGALALFAPHDPG
ncbi:MAG TPA: MFS transporter [Planctomycetaceae bacterium]|jgi:sugar phosphate permease|nr:MFS transporter [Planctomycetaceae bacterium]